MWVHDGQCACGKRRYLHGQCLKCLKDELLGREPKKMFKLGGDPDEKKDSEMNTRPDPGEAVEAAPARIPDSLEFLKSKPSKGWRSNAVYFISPALIDRVFKHQTDWPHHIELKAWEHGKRVELRPIVPAVTNEETNRKKRLPYCMVLRRELRRPNASTRMLTQCHDVRWETRPMSFQDSSWWLSPQTLSSYHHLNEVSDFLDGALWGIPTGRSWVERDLKGALKTLLTPYGIVAEKFRIAS